VYHSYVATPRCTAIAQGFTEKKQPNLASLAVYFAFPGGKKTLSNFVKNFVQLCVTKKSVKIITILTNQCAIEEQLHKAAQRKINILCGTW
jgi:hypothetical protein